MSYTLDLTQLVNQLGLAQPTPTQTASPTPTTTAQQCSTGTSCLDVGICQSSGGTCVASCQYGCCCYAQATPTPTQTAPILTPSPTTAQTPITQTLSPTPSQSPTQTQPTSTYTIDLTPLAQLLQQSQTPTQTAPTQTSTSQPGGPTIYVGGALGGVSPSPSQPIQPTQTPITQTMPPTTQTPQTQPTYPSAQTPTQSYDIAGFVQQLMPLILLLVVMQLVK